MNDELNNVYAALRAALETRWACGLKDLSNEDILESVISELTEEEQDPIVKEMLKYTMRD